MVFRKPQATKGNKLSLSESSEAARPDYNREPPSFCLRYVQPDYCITDCSDEDQLAFVKRIRKLSQMTWIDIIQADRHGLGREKIDRKAIKPTIPRYITEDVTFIALRFSGKKPMVGYQRDRTFHIIWFDRDFNVYDHG
jgi:hypothetical protein